jgi:hypothetical protein
MNNLNNGNCEDNMKNLFFNLFKEDSLFNSISGMMNNGNNNQSNSLVQKLFKIFQNSLMNIRSAQNKEDIEDNTEDNNTEDTGDKKTENTGDTGDNNTEDTGDNNTEDTGDTGDNNTDNTEDNNTENTGDNNTEKETTEETPSELDDIFTKILERIKQQHPDIAEDIEKLTEIFNSDKLFEMFDKVQDEMENVELNNFSDVIQFFQTHLQKNPSVQSTLWKLYMTLQSGLVNLNRMKANSKTILKLALDEFAASNLISAADSQLLTNLLLYGNKFNFKPKKRETQSERQEKRLKKYRRKKKREYQKEKRHKH